MCMNWAVEAAKRNKAKVKAERKSPSRKKEDDGGGGAAATEPPKQEESLLEKWLQVGSKRMTLAPYFLV